MQKILLFVFLYAIIATGCSKTEILDQKEQNSIEFAMFTHKQTKATETSTTTLQNLGTGADIFIKGYLLDNTAVASATTATVYFTDVLDYNGEATEKWYAQNGPYYWPSTTIGAATKSLSFYAYHPTNDAATYADAEFTGNANRPTLTWNCPEVANQVDLIASSLEGQIYTTNAASNGRASMTFNHLLSQINFSCKGDLATMKYYVTEISLMNIYPSAVYTFGGDWAAASGTLTNYVYPINLVGYVDGTATLSYGDGSGAAGATSANVTTATNGAEALMLTPQTLSTAAGSEAKIQIKYYVVDKNGNAILGTQEAPVTKTADITSTWMKNKKYRYLITLTADTYPITFDVNVLDWETETNTNISVN